MTEYPWKRFWIPRGETVDLSDSGFLTVPEGKYAEYYSPKPFTFNQISNIPCLALLGEPGIGKTKTMSKIVNDFSENSPPGNRLLHMDLNEYCDASSINNIFESKEFQNWKNGSHTLHMFLDSLDECRINIPNVGIILASNLKKVSPQLSRLQLRIACRTADWLSILETKLPEIWGENNFRAFELAPLQEKDVRTATEIEEIDSDSFLRELKRTESGPLAARPVTLNFLLKIFSKDNRLPKTRIELYETGCKELCKESSNHRQDLRIGKLSPKQRLAIASRIAAISIFCQKSVICDDSRVDLLEKEDEIGISELAGGKEKLDFDNLSISESNIREVLGTALFSSRGANKTGFAHRTYAEFLAVRYLLETAKMPVDKILRLFQHPNDSGKRVIPQLYETAGWVASKSKEVLEVIAGNDPQILMRADAGMLGIEARELIVDEFLNALDQHRINDRDRKLYHHYHKLNHPKLAGQLSPWIIDSDKSINARNNAIDIAEACGLIDIQLELAKLTLEPNEEEFVRWNAACAVARIADKDTRRLLRPLAFGQISEDSRDQLKGYALQALWPGLITAEELFQNLAPPKKSNFFGAYSRFLRYQLPEKLNTQDLPFALKWLENRVNKSFIRCFFPLFDTTMILSWNHMDNSEVFLALVDTCVELLSNHMGLLRDGDKKEKNSDIFDDLNKRRKLGKAIIEKVPNGSVCTDLIYRWPQITRSEDFEWCAENLLSSISQPTEPLWANLTLILFRWNEYSENKLNTLINARSNSPELKAMSDYDFSPVKLGSEQALKLKKRHESINALIVERKPKKPDYPPEKKVVELLERFESGEYGLWKDIIFWMSLNKDDDPSYYHGYKFMKLDIRKFPGWKNLDEVFHFRILKAAADYLRFQRSLNHEELYRGEDQYTSPATQAFFILWEMDRCKISSLTNEVLEYWAPLILSSFEVEGEEARQGILSKIYERIPGKIAEVFQNIINREVKNNGRPAIVLDIVEKLWDQRIRNIAYNTLPKAEDKPVCWSDLLKALVVHNDPEGIKLAIKKILSADSKKYPHDPLAFQAAIVLIMFSQDAGWPIIWPLFKKRPEFWKKVIMEVAYDSTETNFIENLKEEDIAQLFIWLAKEFPYSEDSHHGGDHSVTKNYRVRYFIRDVLPRTLEDHGTYASCQALQTISEALPELEWIKPVLVEARKNTLKQSWTPFKPIDFIEFTSKTDSVLVRSAEELQELVMQSLSRLEQLLQGETPAAPDLWDQICRKPEPEKFRPKDENHFSDWIKRNLELELRGRGIVVAREVEIRRGEGSGPGERTDIHVSANVPGLSEGAFNKVSVIIESKGCWNPDLMEDMKNQLIDRYLKDNQCGQGIYLVGWFDCSQWNYKKKKVLKCSLKEARQCFGQQACNLSTHDLTIRSFVINAALR